MLFRKKSHRTSQLQSVFVFCFFVFWKTTLNEGVCMGFVQDDVVVFLGLCQESAVCGDDALLNIWHLRVVVMSESFSFPNQVELEKKKRIFLNSYYPTLKKETSFEDPPTSWWPRFMRGVRGAECVCLFNMFCYCSENQVQGCCGQHRPTTRLCRILRLENGFQIFGL